MCASLIEEMGNFANGIVRLPPYAEITAFRLAGGICLG
jgi:hypothetical protein